MFSSNTEFKYKPSFLILLKTHKIIYPLSQVTRFYQLLITAHVGPLMNEEKNKVRTLNTSKDKGQRSSNQLKCSIILILIF